jgi:hypothetical protein
LRLSLAWRLHYINHKGQQMAKETTLTDRYKWNAHQSQQLLAVFVVLGRHLDQPTRVFLHFLGITWRMADNIRNNLDVYIIFNIDSFNSPQQ